MVLAAEGPCPAAHLPLARAAPAYLDSSQPYLIVTLPTPQITDGFGARAFGKCSTGLSHSRGCAGHGRAPAHAAYSHSGGWMAPRQPTPG